MTARTEGFILKRTPYGDNSAVLKVFTRELGLATFMLHGLFRKKGGGSNPACQVLNRVELIYYDNPNGTMRKLREIALCGGGHAGSLHPLNLQSGMFGAELLAVLLKEEQNDPELYELFAEYLYALQGNNVAPALPVWFVLRVTANQGLLPDFSIQMEQAGFDPIRGRKVLHAEPYNPAEIIDSVGCRLACELLQREANTLTDTPLPSAGLRNLFDLLLVYTSLHMLDGKTLKSVEIIRDVIRN
jgi:DNA repair protein RecO (recombination protein O)